MNANLVPARCNQPKCAAQHTSAGAVSERNPATHPSRNTRIRADIECPPACGRYQRVDKPMLNVPNQRHSPLKSGSLFLPARKAAMKHTEGILAAFGCWNIEILKMSPPITRPAMNPDTVTKATHIGSEMDFSSVALRRSSSQVRHLLCLRPFVFAHRIRVALYSESSWISRMID